MVALYIHSAILTDDSSFGTPHKLASDAHDILICLIQVLYFYTFLFRRRHARLVNGLKLFELQCVQLELSQTYFHSEVKRIFGFA